MGTDWEAEFRALEIIFRLATRGRPRDELEAVQALLAAKAQERAGVIAHPHHEAFDPPERLALAALRLREYLDRTSGRP